MTIQRSPKCCKHLALALQLVLEVVNEVSLEVYSPHREVWNEVLASIVGHLLL